VFQDEIFYIGVYCEKKCNFELLAKLEEEFEIQDGIMYKAFIAKEDALSFRLKTKPDYEEIEIVAFSPTMGAFKIFVRPQKRPSSQNTIQAIPSWVGAYSVNVVKGSKDYCSDCFYYIVLTAEQKPVEVFFYAKYETTITTLRSDEPVFSAIKPFQTHCYQYDIDTEDRKENVIVQTVMFSGKADLKIQMNAKPDMTTLVQSDPFFHEIYSEKFIKLTPEDRLASNTKSKIETGPLIVCLTASEKASYILKMVYESQVEDMQKYNYLIRGREINGYLPKDQATRYRIFDFDSNSDLTVSMNVKKGDPKLYGYICESMNDCFFDKAEIAKQLNNGKMILPEEYSIGYTLTIKDKINTCHKKTTDESPDLNCGVLAVVMCEGEEECEYMLRSTRDDIVHDLLPRKPHYQVIPYNETDLYKFVIEDDTVESVNIILNTLSGNADMLLNYVDKNKNSLVEVSQYEAYLPDVIRIDKAKLKRPNLKGTYNISVYGSSFSSYSIYYYTNTDTRDDDKNLPSVGVSLDTGHIIKDIFEPKTDYKIYTYDPKLSEDLDIRITLTPEKDDYYMFVLYDIKDFVFNKESPISSEGYLWSDNYTNEVIIRKTDLYYKRSSMIYIVVIADYYNGQTDHTSSYWIGATTENNPFLLYEGVPNSVTLDDDYTVQTYWYTHPKISDPFSLTLNTFYGRVDVFVDFKEITDFNSKDITATELDTDTAYITIQPDVLKTKCPNGNNCGILIYVRKSSKFETQYLIVAKSHPNVAEILSNGIMRTDSVFTGEFKNYQIITDNLNLNMIYVSFLTGYGEVYINVPRDISSMKKAKYPTRLEHDYEATDYYLGKFINLDESKLPKRIETCQILVTVYANSMFRAENKAEYSISFYNQSRKINQNQPLRGNIREAEIQYFNVNFEKGVENIYVSLTNMDGDVDIYMNYGLSYPTMQNYTWKSDSLTSEFIEFNKNDNFFLSTKETDISGEYTLMLVGLTNSTYSLYITSHPRRIIPVNSYQPASCRSNGTNPCYFRFNDFYLNGREIYDIIITTDYLYGTGSIYANLYSKTDYEILNEMPTSSISDYSSVKSNTRNMLNIKIDKSNAKLTEDSMLLIAVQCQQKCFFDLNIAEMFVSDLMYLDTNKENTFYIYKSDNKTLLVYYNWSQKNINLVAHSYSGSAMINMFTNTTKFNDASGAYVTTKNNLGQFYLDNQYSTVIENKNDDITYRDVFFEVDAQTDVAFSLKLTHDREWTSVKLNKINTFSINTTVRNLYLYFDMMEEYDSAIVSVKSLTKDVKIFAYIKYALIDKSSANADKGSLHDYTVPGIENYDFSGHTYTLFNQVSIKIPGVNVDENKSKFKRVLINLVTDYSSINPPNDIQLELMVTPKINGRTIIQAQPNTLVFSQMEDDKKDFTIFDLKKNKPTDDLMVIEISNCEGDVKFKFSDVLASNYDDKSILMHEEIDSGRKTLQFDLTKFTSEDFYLTLLPNQSNKHNCVRNEKEGTLSCSKKSETLVYYFTTRKESYASSFLLSRGTLKYKRNESDSIALTWDKAVANIDEMFKEVNSEFSIFISEDEKEYSNMDNICYLSRMSPPAKYKISRTDRVTANISGLESGKKYFMNVMAKTEANDILAYKPIEIIIESNGIPLYLIVIIIVLVITLLYLVYYFYKKYRITRKVLEYEVNDVRNLSTLPKTETEMRNVIKAEHNKKYVVLSEKMEESV